MPADRFVSSQSSGIQEIVCWAQLTSPLRVQLRAARILEFDLCCRNIFNQDVDVVLPRPACPADLQRIEQRLPTTYTIVSRNSRHELSYTSFFAFRENPESSLWSMLTTQHLLAVLCSWLPPAGQSRCLEAFIVALNQAGEGWRNLWYVSTLELQLVSLEFCRARRRIPTLGVLVDGRTVRSLWVSPMSKTGQVASSSKEVCTSARVPVVRAFRLTWALSMKDLLESVFWPTGFKGLVLDVDLEVPVEEVPWPQSLEHLVFGSGFNMAIAAVVWPASLRGLSLGDEFNQPIAGAVWPVSLQQLYFGDGFN